MKSPRGIERHFFIHNFFFFEIPNVVLGAGYGDKDVGHYLQGLTGWWEGRPGNLPVAIDPWYIHRLWA